MPYIVVDGRKKYIPAAYSEMNVISDQGAAMPDFNVGLLMGECDEGYPYYWNDSLKKDTETAIDRFPQCGTSYSVQSNFGRNSQVKKAFEEAKKHGLTQCFVTAVNTLTRGKIDLYNALTKVITLYPKKAGALPTFGKIEVSTSGSNRIIKYYPVKMYAKLAATATATAQLIIRDGGDQLKEDGSYLLVDTDSTAETVTISKITKRIANSTDTGKTDANFKLGQLIYLVDLAATCTGTFSVGKFASLIQIDDQNYEQTSALATNAELISWINNNSKYLFAEQVAETPLVANLAAVIIKEATYGTAGTWTALADADWTTFFDGPISTTWYGLASYLEELQADTGYMIRQFCMVTPKNDSLLKFRNWANTQRTAGLPKQGIGGTDSPVVTTGGSADTNPATGAPLINSQDMILFGGGADYEPAYLSTAPAVFGIRVGNSIKHNLTRDVLYYSKPEIIWDEINSGKLTSLTRAGVMTYKKTKNGLVIVEGINSLQNNENVWNVNDKTTCSPRQRDLADYAAEIIRAGLDNDEVGADSITEIGLKVYARATFENLKFDGFITSYTIDSITLNSQGNGYDIEWSCQLPGDVNFIKVITNILV